MENSQPSVLSAAALGRPLGPYAVFGNVFCRVYAEGMSIINPNDHPIALELGRPYRTAEGRLITRLELNPHTKVTLLGA